MTDLQLLIIVIVVGILYLGWRIDRAAKAVAAAAATDASEYLGDIAQELETIRTLLRAAPVLKPGPYKPAVPNSSMT